MHSLPSACLSTGPPQPAKHRECGDKTPPFSKRVLSADAGPRAVPGSGDRAVTEMPPRPASTLGTLPLAILPAAGTPRSSQTARFRLPFSPGKPSRPCVRFRAYRLSRRWGTGSRKRRSGPGHSLLDPECTEQSPDPSGSIC